MKTPMEDLKYGASGICESDEKFRVLFEMSPSPMFLETVQGRIIDCNSAAVKMTGYSAKELLSMSAADLVPKKIAKIFPKLIEAELTKGAFQVRAENRRKNGEIYPVEATGQVVIIDGRKYVFVTVIDITSQQSEINKLKESEEGFRLLFNGISDGVLVADIKTKKFFLSNPAMEKMLGMTAAEIAKLSVMDIHPEGAVADALAQFNDVAKKKRDLVENVPLKRKDGSVIYADVRGYLFSYKGAVYTVGLFRDVTEKNRMIKARDLENQKIFILHQIVSIANRAGTMSVLLKEALLPILQTLGFDGGGIYLVDEEKKVAQVVESYNLQKKFLQAVKSINISKKPYNTIFLKGEPLITENYDKLFPKKRNLTKFKSLVSVPLIAGDRVIGALNIASEKRSTIPESIKEILVLVGKELGNAVKRVQAEEKLKRHDVQFRTIINHSLDIIFTFDRSGKVVFITPNVSQAGYDYKEIVGQPFENFIHPDDVPRIKKELSLVIKTRKVFYSNLRLLKKDGGFFYVEEYGTPVFDEAGRFTLFTGALRDVSERVKAEEERRNYTDRLQIMFEDAPDAYYLSDLKGVIVDGNKAAEKITGYRKKELIGRNFLHLHKLIARGQKTKVLTLLTKNIKGGSTGPDEFQLIKKDGTSIFVEISTHPVVIEGQPLILGIARDITGRKAAEDAIKIERDKASSLLNIVGTMVVALDKQGVVYLANRRVCEVLGYAEKDIVGKNWFNDFVPARMRKDVYSVFNKLMRGKEKALEFFENPVSTRGGKERVIAWHNILTKDERGIINGTLSAGEDITERKLAEAELLSRMTELEKTKKTLTHAYEDVKKEKNLSQILAKDLEKFKMAVEGASDHIVITDTDAKIVFANHAAERITGFSISEMIGKDPSELWGGQMNKDFFKKMWQVIKSEKKAYYGELKNKRKSGEVYDAEIHISPILNNAGEVLFFVGLEKDITKAKEIDRMKSEFVTIASHQLRTPLTTIKWYAELLMAAQNDLNKKSSDYVHKIYDSNQKMIRLVNDLLNVSRIESGKKFLTEKTPVDIVPLIRRAVTDQSVIAVENNVRIKIVNLPKKLVLNIDDEKIYQVFQNLINNAVKYSRPGDRVEVNCEKNSEGMLATIRDRGLGIPSSQQDRIFEKFFRADNVVESGKGGTGLGLYIAQAIIEGHDGRLWFDSAEKQGTTFYIQLPK